MLALHLRLKYFRNSRRKRRYFVYSHLCTVSKEWKQNITTKRLFQKIFENWFPVVSGRQMGFYYHGEKWSGGKVRKKSCPLNILLECILKKSPIFLNAKMTLTVSVQPYSALCSINCASFKAGKCFENHIQSDLLIYDQHELLSNIKSFLVEYSKLNIIIHIICMNHIPWVKDTQVLGQCSQSHKTLPTLLNISASWNLGTF